MALLMWRFLFQCPSCLSRKFSYLYREETEIENKKQEDELISSIKFVICSKIFKLGFQFTVFINYDLSGCICLTFLIFMNQEMKKAI